MIRMNSGQIPFAESTAEPREIVAEIEIPSICPTQPMQQIKRIRRYLQKHFMEMSNISAIPHYNN